jgi:hypothetical protein
VLNPNAREACVLCLDHDAPYVELVLLRAAHELVDPDALSLTILPATAPEQQRSKAHEDADWFVVVVSPDGMRSDALRAEASAAYASHPDRVICLTMPGGDPLGLHPDLALSMHIEVDPDSPAVTHDRLAHAVRSMISAPARNLPVEPTETTNLIHRRAEATDRAPVPEKAPASKAEPPASSKDAPSLVTKGADLAAAPTNGASPSRGKAASIEPTESTATEGKDADAASGSSGATAKSKAKKTAGDATGTAAHVDALLETLAKGKSEDRWQAVASLRTVSGDARVLPALLEALADKDALVRRRAVRALREIGSPDQRVKAALHEALKDHAGMVRRQAAECLREMGEVVDQAFDQTPSDRPAAPVAAPGKPDKTPTLDDDGRKADEPPARKTAKKAAASVEPSIEKGTQLSAETADTSSKPTPQTSPADKKPSRKKSPASADKPAASGDSGKKAAASRHSEKGTSESRPRARRAANAADGLIRFVGGPDPADAPTEKKPKKPKSRAGKARSQASSGKSAPKTEPTVTGADKGAPSLPDGIIPRQLDLDATASKETAAADKEGSPAEQRPPEAGAKSTAPETFGLSTPDPLLKEVSDSDAPVSGASTAEAAAAEPEKRAVADGIADHLFGPTLGGPVSQDYLTVRTPGALRMGNGGTVDAQIMGNTVPAMMAALRGNGEMAQPEGKHGTALVWAELEAGSDAFQIESRDAGPYLIDDASAADASWQWRITPLQRGKQTLTVRLRGHVVIGGHETAEFSLLPITRKVRVRGNQLSGLMRMLGWLIALCAAAAVGMYAENRTRAVDEYLELPSSGLRDTESGRRDQPSEVVPASSLSTEENAGGSSSVTVPIAPFGGGPWPSERSADRQEEWRAPGAGGIVPAGLPRGANGSLTKPSASGPAKSAEPPDSSA